MYCVNLRSTGCSYCYLHQTEVSSVCKISHMNNYCYPLCNRENQGRIQDLAKADGPWRAREERAYNGVLEAEPPAGSRGRAPGGGQGRGLDPLKLKAFRLFSYKKGQKFSI